ncbi:RNA-binding domain-containing protein, partial [Delitschia confertaspora ATCC 74209]
FAGFAPRSVASRAPTVTAPQVYAPQMMTTQAPMNGAGYQPTAYPQQGSYYPQQSYVNPAAPTIINPFLNQGAKNGAYDPEMEARIAEWSSAYMPKDDAAGKKPTGNDTSYGSTQSVQVGHSDSKNVASGVEGEKKKTVVRQGGGKVWEDTSLTEWDPSHPRLMVGNLAGEVTDESLLKAFSKYPSVQKTRVVRDKRTTKSKGYGFVSFSDTDDFFRAAKEMKGKYIGSHPVTVERARTEIKVTTEKDRKHGKNGK